MKVGDMSIAGRVQTQWSFPRARKNSTRGTIKRDQETWFEGNSGGKKPIGNAPAPKNGIL